MRSALAKHGFVLAACAGIGLVGCRSIVQFEDYPESHAGDAAADRDAAIADDARESLEGAIGVDADRGEAAPVADATIGDAVMPTESSLPCTLEGQAPASGLICCSGLTDDCTGVCIASIESGKDCPQGACCLGADGPQLCGSDPVCL